MKLNETTIITLFNMLVDAWAMVVLFFVVSRQKVFTTKVANKIIDIKSIDIMDVGLAHPQRRGILRGDFAFVLLFLVYNLTKVIANFPPFPSVTAECTSVATSIIVIYRTNKVIKVYGVLKKYV